MKLTGPAWAAKLNINVLDPDGWRMDDTPFDTALTLDEFMYRVMFSTLMYNYQDAPEFRRLLKEQE